jgi:DNA modification methylase
MKHLKKIKRR